MAKRSITAPQANGSAATTDGGRPQRTRQPSRKVESERKRQRTVDVDRIADTDRKSFKEALQAPPPQPRPARAVAPLLPENQQPIAKPAKAPKKAKPTKLDKKIKQGVITTKADVKKLPREEKQIFDVHEEVRADSERKLLGKATFRASSKEDQRGVIMVEMKKAMCPSTPGAKSLFREDYATVTVELAAMELRSRVRQPGRGAVEDMHMDESDAEDADVEIVRLPLSKRRSTKRKKSTAPLPETTPHGHGGEEELMTDRVVRELAKHHADIDKATEKVIAKNRRKSEEELEARDAEIQRLQRQLQHDQHQPHENGKSRHKPKQRPVRPEGAHAAELSNFRTLDLTQGESNAMVAAEGIRPRPDFDRQGGAKIDTKNGDRHATNADTSSSSESEKEWSEIPEEAEEAEGDNEEVQKKRRTSPRKPKRHDYSARATIAAEKAKRYAVEAKLEQATRAKERSRKKRRPTATQP